MIRKFYTRWCGFTAIEITMVAAIIAILALLILPLYRKRSEDARITAARDDMQGLAKSLMLAQADTELYLRLQDLDNARNLTGNADIDYPIAKWNDVITKAKRDAMQAPNGFQGPYAAIQNYITLNQLKSADPSLTTYNTFINTYMHAPGQSGGPILRIPNGYSGSENGYDSDNDKIPVDPWGTPYLLFGPGKVNAGGGSSETDYGSSILYSLGPDGQPGSGVSVTQKDYFRETGVLGTGDDIKFEF